MITIDRESALKTVKNFTIPNKPKILIDIQAELQKETVSLERITQIIKEDAALSASILKAINSPSYGLSRTITDIGQSIIFLGINSIVNLTNCFALKSAFNEKASISLENFWRESSEVANMSTLVLEHANLKHEIPPEDLYAYALLENCGIPAMAIKYKNYDAIVKEISCHDNLTYTEHEEKSLNTDHAVVGYFIANSWNLPKAFCHYILAHHEPRFREYGDLDDKTKKIIALLKMTSNIYHNYRFADDDPEWHLFRENVFGMLVISEQDYAEICEEVLEELVEHAL